MERQSREFTYLHAIVIFTTIALLGFFIVFMAITMNYLKTVAMTIKTILKAAFEAKSPFLAFKDDIAKIKHTKLREEAEMWMKDTNKNKDHFTRWTVILDKWSCNREPQYNNQALSKFKKRNFNLLQPPPVFYAFLYITGMIVVWLCSGLFTGVFSSSLIENLLPGIILIPLLVALISTILIIIFIHIVHYFYLLNIRTAFK